MINRWLTFSQDIRKSTEADTREGPTNCFTTRRGTLMIDNWYPPTERCIKQCEPTFSVANPHVCLGPPLKKLNENNWMTRGGLRRLRPRKSSELSDELRPVPQPYKYPDRSTKRGVTRRDRFLKMCDRTLKIII